MGIITEFLVEYGVLGLWVVFSIYREKQLTKRMDELELRHRLEREQWNHARTRWQRTIARKLSDQTFIETQE